MNLCIHSNSEAVKFYENRGAQLGFKMEEELKKRVKGVKDEAALTTYENHIMRALLKTDDKERKASVSKYVTKNADIPVSALLPQMQDKIKEAMAIEVV